MMRDNGILDKFPEVVKAMEEVVRKGGFGTSVTPVSQFYFQQAFNNVMQGKWKKIAEGYGKMVLGYFGKTPVEPDPEVVKIASEQLGLEPTTRSPLEINDENPKKQVSFYREQLKAENLPETDENIFIAAACGAKGIAFLKGEGKIGVRYKEKTAAKAASGNYEVTVNGKAYLVALDGDKITVGGKPYTVDVKESSASAPKAAASSGASVDVKAPVPGTIMKLLVSEGTVVKENDPLAMIEVMKMETPIPAPKAGTVGKILVHQGDQVVTDQLLMTLN